MNWHKDKRGIRCVGGSFDGKYVNKTDSWLRSGSEIYMKVIKVFRVDGDEEPHAENIYRLTEY